MFYLMGTLILIKGQPESKHDRSLTYLTVDSGVARWTGAVVLVRFGVHAGPSVDAGLVVAAVIQI